MKPPTTPLQARILAALRAGEIDDRALYTALKPTPVGTAHRALLQLQNAGRVISRLAGTRLRLS